MVKKRDQIYLNPQNNVSKFVFDDKVASVFDDMISRSVPGYEQILRLLPTLVKQFHRDNGRYYDLGCSLGAGMQAMAKGLNELSADKGVIIGVDTSQPMLQQAEALLKLSNDNDISFELQNTDITNTEISEAAIVLMNFTLQFIPLEKRSALIKSIYTGLYKGGALILSEKIKFDEQKTDQTMINLHHQYKADQGYSQLEISQKRDAIENVLIPETLETHIHRLRSAGFNVITPWVQNLQFISILAIK